MEKMNRQEIIDCLSHIDRHNDLPEKARQAIKAACQFIAEHRPEIPNPNTVQDCYPKINSIRCTCGYLYHIEDIERAESFYLCPRCLKRARLVVKDFVRGLPVNPELDDVEVHFEPFWQEQG